MKKIRAFCLTAPSRVDKIVPGQLFKAVGPRLAGATSLEDRHDICRELKRPQEGPPDTDRIYTAGGDEYTCLA